MSTQTNWSVKWFAFDPFFLCAVSRYLPDAVPIVVGHENAAVICSHDVVGQFEWVSLNELLDPASARNFLDLPVLTGCRQDPQNTIVLEGETSWRVDDSVFLRLFTASRRHLPDAMQFEVSRVNCAVPGDSNRHRNSNVPGRQWLRLPFIIKPVHVTGC